MRLPLPSPAVRALARLGEDLSRARRRRSLSQASTAERSGVSVATLKRLEKGDPGVGIEHLARVLHLLGELDRLERLLDTGADAVGLVLMDERLPQRVRRKGSARAL